jgi:uncharacterized protein YraI
MITSLRLLALAAGLALSIAADAQTAYTARDANLRAGPGRDYPLVSWLPQGTPITVAGCYEGWRWCDVIAPPNRGWVYAGFLSYPYQGRTVTILDAGPMLGLALVPFSVGIYWDNYYRTRPWYGRRSYWEHRPPPHYRPPHYRPPTYRPPTQPSRPPSVRPPRPIAPTPRPPARPSPPTIQPVPSRPGVAPPRPQPPVTGRPVAPAPTPPRPAPRPVTQ